MPTTRQMNNGNGRPMSAAELESRTGYDPYVNTSRWQPTVIEADSPIEYGMEVFFHKRMPDGTPLGTEGRRYLAAVIMNSLKGE